ncbi:helix-turn-helix domain-containing protein [Paenibacillus alkaliterrae]|uniref:helix-turn-helix domain-containing protein n=1 Tax=Paenibacillus alkaliterrae TaxID=320909 RepID=UPI001F2E8D9B|nr:helix-turn-helix domain-containing protein [Paenibacillus alkaliterrae]MCF2937967.1 helix-turn-helix domain-containing protein [Paenibacillus alkaliterrae]
MYNHLKHFIRRKDGRKSVFITLFLSYVIILLIPVAIGSVFYPKIERILIDNANRSNVAMLEQARRAIDSRVKEINSFASHIAFHPKLSRLLDQNRYAADNNTFTFVEFMREINRYHIMNSFVDEFYIYFNESDIILSPSMKTVSKVWFESIYRYRNLNYEYYLKQILQPYRYQTFLPSEEMESGTKRYQMITYIHSLPRGEQENVKGSLVMLIDERKLLDMLASIDGMQKGSVIIENDAGEVLMSTAGRTDYSDRDPSLIITRTISAQNGWTYVSIVPKSVVLSQVNTLKKWAILVVFFCIAGGGMICYHMAYRNYRPIRELVHAVINGRKSDQHKDHHNEFELIRTTVSHLFVKEKDLEDQLSRNLPVIQADFLSRLIRGRVDATTVSSQDLEFMDLSFTHSCFAVMIVDIEDCSRFIKEDTEREWALLRFILANISKELLNKPAYAIEMERDRIVILINNDKISENLNCDDLYAFAEELLKIMEARFKTQVTAALSTIHSGVGNIGKCYSEAIFAMDYKMIKGPSSILYYEEVRHSKKDRYHYPIEMESQLMNYARNGDIVHVEKLLDHIYEVNFLHTAGMTPELVRCLFFEMFSTLQKLSHSLNYSSDAASGTDPAKFFQYYTTAEEMYAKLKRDYKEFCSVVKLQRTDHSAQLYRKITVYINEHFYESGLSLTMMADYFELNSSYMSTFFKNYSGQNITDYLLNLRIQKTKELLLETSLTISDIAERVGYASNIGLIRVFKKVEGITPGQYRTNHALIQQADNRSE